MNREIVSIRKHLRNVNATNFFPQRFHNYFRPVV